MNIKRNTMIQLYAISKEQSFRNLFTSGEPAGITVLNVKGAILKKINILQKFVCVYIYIYIYINICKMAQLAGAVEYIDCIFAEGENSPNQCPVYDAKQSDVETPVMLKLWGIWNTPSLPSLPGSFWPRVVVIDRVLSMGQIELFDI